LFKIEANHPHDFTKRPKKHVISSVRIRTTNQDAIDLYNRLKLGTPVVVLGLGHLTQRGGS
jgi:hypothetical protein